MRGDAETYEEVRYEGYGPGGVAVIVEALTDNRNRTAGFGAGLLFAKNGGSLGETGSVAFSFDRVGEIALSGRRSGDADTVLEAAIEAGAEDVVERRERPYDHYCAFEDLNSRVEGARGQTLGDPESVNAVWRPSNMAEVDEDKGGTLMKLIDALEDDDDVQNVYSNFEMSDDVLAKLTAA